MDGFMSWRVALGCCAAISLVAGSAAAGPPFVSDDPEPTDTGHWEIYNFVTGTHTPGQTAGAAGLDLNYGPIKDLQLTAVIPLAYQTGQTGVDPGLGDIELGAKYRFLHQAEGSLMPDVAVFPRLFVPTGGRQRGTGRFSLLLPIWAQKDIGKWSVFGGGGYTINPGPGQRNFWLSGAALSRPVTDRLTLGIEVFHQTPDAIDAKDFTGMNLGVIYKLTDHWSLLASGGPGLQNAAEEGRYTFYVSLKADY
jgi:hypothetical protein